MTHVPIRAVDAVLGEPWLITQGGLERVLYVASREQLFVEEGRRARLEWGSEPDERPRGYCLEGDGVAVIDIRGPVFQHANLLTEISGATSQEGIRSALRAALADPSVRGVLLRISSPGGQAHGVADLADEIRAADSIKPVEAFIPAMGASAACWFAVAARRVTISQSGEQGSIGCIAAYVDESKAEELRGERTIRFVSSVSPLKCALPTTEEGRNAWQANVDRFGVLFVEAVARFRRVSVEHVLTKFGRGDLLVGRDAVAVGLADRVGTFEQTLADLGRPRTFTATAPRAAAPQETSMNCAKCGNPIEGDAYCKSCYDAGQQAQAQAMGLAPGATAQQVRDRVTALVGFEKRILAATGVASLEEAHGTVVAAMASHREMPTIRAGLAKAETTSRRNDLRAALEKGLLERRLSAGMILETAPLLVADEGRRKAMSDAFAALPETVPEGKTWPGLVVDAACSVDVSESELRTVQTWAKRAAPVMAGAVQEQRRDTAAEAGQLNELGQEIAGQLGMEKETVEEYGGIRSASDLRKKQASKKTTQDRKPRSASRREE